MAELLNDSTYSSLNLGDILFAIFKHRWKIVICGIAGILAALGVHFFYTPMYESHAKLLVRYVMERTPIDPDANSGGRSGSNIIGSEVEIITSWDLAVQVAEALGPQRLLPQSRGAPSVTDAAAVVASGLTVIPSTTSNIIFVGYKNPDPDLARLVLDELVNRYFNKHLEVHRSAGAFDFVTQQTDQVHARLNETEDALRTIKSKAGVASLAEGTTDLGTSFSRVSDQLQTTEEAIAEQTARVQALESKSSETSDSKSVGPQDKEKGAPPRASAKGGEPKKAGGVTSKDAQHYQAVVSRLEKLRAAELELIGKYTPENVIVKFNENQIANLEKERNSLEERFPELTVTSSNSTTAAPNLASERAKLAGLTAKAERLKARLEGIRAGIKKVTELSSQIADLERNQELEVANYKYFKATLEKARVDEALDPSKMPNISAVQRPSVPARVFGKRDKIVMGLAGGGIGLAIALTLLVELVLNQTIKRPIELERRLGTRLLMAIPDCRGSGKAHLRLPWRKNGKNGNNGATLVKGAAAPLPWEIGHFIRPYSEAIRDRLGLYFELNRMTHKPKLVGVTGFKTGAGASTLAAGLAASFSELGEGKVLLVDLNVAEGEVHPFFDGRPALSLGAALQLDNGVPPAADNLYLATVATNTPGAAQLGLKKFFDLMPNLKASDFDYIIFDMPPLNQTSPTLGMAGFMDKMLLIVEGEKNSRETVKRGYEALVAGRDNVSMVFNKTHSYTPEWLHSDS